MANSLVSLLLDPTATPQDGDAWASYPVTRVAVAPGVSAIAQTSDNAILTFAVLDTRRWLQTVTNGEIHATCAALRGISERAYLILIGSLVSHRDGTTLENGQITSWPWSSIMGARASYQEHGVIIVDVLTPANVPAAIDLIARRDRTASRTAPMRDVLFPDCAVLALMALGMTEARADTLMRHCGGLANALVLLTGTDPLPDPFDATTRLNTRSVLGLSADVTLGLMMSELAVA